MIHSDGFTLKCETVCVYAFAGKFMSIKYVEFILTTCYEKFQWYDEIFAVQAGAIIKIIFYRKWFLKFLLMDAQHPMLLLH